MAILSPLAFCLLASVLFVSSNNGVVAIGTEANHRIRGSSASTPTTMVEINPQGVRRLMMEKENKTPAQTTAPSISPSASPTASAQPSQSFAPSAEPSVSASPTEEFPLSYVPGDFSQQRTSDDGLLKLSNGLTCKRIATSGEPVKLADGTYSMESFHDQPDGASVFPRDDGGWYYVSNAENTGLGSDWQDGGVGSIEFDASGNILDYRRVASNLQRNCGGGRSPWNTWITCEEITENKYLGKVYQVDPSGKYKTSLDFCTK